jgi:aromatic amino acid aminotransferase I
VGLCVYRWSRIARLLLNPGDTLLVEEWTYPSALASARPLDIRWKAVPMDGQGMRPDSLRAILAGWNVEQDGPRCVCVPFTPTIESGNLVPIRPRVIYTVPVGQNPSGRVRGKMQLFGSADRSQRD